MPAAGVSWPEKKVQVWVAGRDGRASAVEWRSVVAPSRAEQDRKDSGSNCCSCGLRSVDSGGYDALDS